MRRFRTPPSGCSRFSERITSFRSTICFNISLCKLPLPSAFPHQTRHGFLNLPRHPVKEIQVALVVQRRHGAVTFLVQLVRLRGIERNARATFHLSRGYWLLSHREERRGEIINGISGFLKPLDP